MFAPFSSRRTNGPLGGRSWQDGEKGEKRSEVTRILHAPLARLGALLHIASAVPCTNTLRIDVAYRPSPEWHLSYLLHGRWKAFIREMCHPHPRSGALLRGVAGANDNIGPLREGTALRRLRDNRRTAGCGVYDNMSARLQRPILCEANRPP